MNPQKIWVHEPNCDMHIISDIAHAMKRVWHIWQILHIYSLFYKHSFTKSILGPGKDMTSKAQRLSVPEIESSTYRIKPCDSRVTIARKATSCFITVQLSQASLSNMRGVSWAEQCTASYSEQVNSQECKQCSSHDIYWLASVARQGQAGRGKNSTTGLSHLYSAEIKCCKSSGHCTN